MFAAVSVYDLLRTTAYTERARPPVCPSHWWITENG